HKEPIMAAGRNYRVRDFQNRALWPRSQVAGAAALRRSEMMQPKTATLTALFLAASMTLGPADVIGQTQPGRALADGRQRRASVEPVSDEVGIQGQIEAVYRDFYSSYRLGPGDVIAIHVDKHPDDSLERTVVSPAGQIYYALMGNVMVGG